MSANNGENGENGEAPEDTPGDIDPFYEDAQRRAERRESDTWSTVVTFVRDGTRFRIQVED